MTDHTPKGGRDFLRAAYVYLNGCEEKCGNCSQPHKLHHYAPSHSCGECKRIIEPKVCKNFRGWHQWDGCEACRNTLATRLGAYALVPCPPEPEGDDPEPLV